MSVLIVSNGPDAVASAGIAALAGQAEAVIAIDGGGRRCLDAGVLPVLVVGDLDSLDSEAADHLRASGVEFSVHPVLKDRSDLDIALEIVAQRWGGDVTITGVLGGRLDHTLASIGCMFAASGLDLDVVESDLDAWIVRADGRQSVEVEGDGTVFSVFGVGDSSVSISGAFWPLADEPLAALSSLGLSNRVEGPTATVTAVQGSVLVIRPQV